jgi:hypothetical protein
VTIILGGDSLNKTIPHERTGCQKSVLSKDYIIFKAAAMSGATIMTITLHSWKIKIGLGIIKVKRMLVLAWVELSTRGRTFSIHVPLYKTRCVV